MYAVCATYEILDRWHKSHLFKVDFREVFAIEMYNMFDDHGSAMALYLRKKRKKLYAKFKDQMMQCAIGDYKRYYDAMMDLAYGGSI